MFDVNKITDKLPVGSVVYAEDNCVKITVPADGFEKLVAYSTQKGDWTHKDYRSEPKKNRKRGKK